MKNNSKIEIIGIIFIIISAFLFAIRSILVKFAYEYNISAVDLLYYRFLFTLPLIWSFALFYKKKQFFVKICDKEIFIYSFLAGIFGYYLATLFDFHSLELINVNINRVISHTFPIYVIVWNSILSRKYPKKSDIVNFILIEICLFLTLDVFSSDFNSMNKLGYFYAFLVAISYSIYYILNQKVGKKIGSVLFTTYSLSFSFVFVNIHFSIINDHQINITSIPNEGLLIIISMAFFCTFLPLLLVSEGIRRLGSNRSAIINSAGPVISIILAFFILGEVMSLHQIIGAIAVLLILYRVENKKIKLGNKY